MKSMMLLAVIDIALVSCRFIGLESRYPCRALLCPESTSSSSECDADSSSDTECVSQRCSDVGMYVENLSKPLQATALFYEEECRKMVGPFVSIIDTEANSLCFNSCKGSDYKLLEQELAKRKCKMDRHFVEDMQEKECERMVKAEEAVRQELLRNKEEICRRLGSRCGSELFGYLKSFSPSSIINVERLRGIVGQELERMVFDQMEVVRKQKCVSTECEMYAQTFLDEGKEKLAECIRSCIGRKIKRIQDGEKEMFLNISRLRADYQKVFRETAVIELRNLCMKIFPGLFGLSCKNDLRKCSEDRAELEDALKKCNEDRAELEDALKECMDDKAELENDLKECGADKTKLEDALKECMDDKAELENDLKECNEDKTKLEDALKECGADKTKLENDLKECGADKTKLEDALKECNEDKTKLEDALEECGADKTKLEDDLRRCNEDKTKP
jgi:hypothetical protein